MRKQLFLSAAIAAVVAVAGATIKQFTPLALPVSTAEESSEQLKFMVTMNQSQAWTSNGATNMQYAVYQLEPDATSYFSRLSAIESAKVADAAVYYDGGYYTIKVPSDATFLRYTSTFTRYDVDTWEKTNEVTFANGNANVAEDMTMDYTTGTVYAIGNNKYNGSERQLKTVDLETGEMTKVGVIGSYIYAIAADANGQLWGVGTPERFGSVTNLYKIDKSSGATTLVGTMDINHYSASLSSLTFDLRSGKLYFAAVTYVDDADLQRTYTNGLFEINTSTAKTTLLRVFENREVVAGLNIKDCHAKAPKAPTNLQFVFDEGSTVAGKVTCKLPTLTYDNNTITGTVDVLVTIDGETVAEASGLNPGDDYATSTLTLDAGDGHLVKVFCLSSGRKSVPAQDTVFAGIDAPAAPENIAVTVNDEGNAIHISWDPAKSENGGYIDESSLLYDVTLMPDNTVLAADLKATELDYTFVNRNMAIAQIRVVAKVGETASSFAASPVFVAGTPWPVPYLEPFNYADEAYWPFTVIDVNNDENEYGFRWYYGPSQRAAWYYSTPTVSPGDADDWLITPAIALDPQKVYRLQFDTYGYMGGKNKMDVVLGSRPTVEKMNHIIYNCEYNTPGYSAAQPYNVECLFIPNSGDTRLGFHNIGDNSDHVFLDNIYISVYGTLAIPQAVTNLNAEKGSDGVKLSFNAPTHSVEGQPLSALTDVKVYRNNVDGELLATIAAPAPGAALEYVDGNYGSGIKTYMVVASSAEGPGIQATVVINTNADVPRAVENFTVTPRNGWSEALLEWNYPASMTGVNGGALSSADITYDIYRVIDWTATLIAQGVSGNSYYDAACSTAIPSDRRQIYMTYRVVPRTTGGEGASSESDRVLMGLSYPLPFAESWANQSQQNYTWESDCSSYADWIVYGERAYDPMTTCQDGDGGLVSFNGSRYGSATGYYTSPRMDVSNYANPKVTFHLYRSTDTNTQSSYLRIGFLSEEAGREILDTRYNVYSTTAGWEEYTVAIPAKYAKSNRLALVLFGAAANNKGSVHVDNITITGEQPEREVKAQRIIGGESCLIGASNGYDVEVANIGTSPMQNISVSLYADDKLVDTKTIASIASGECGYAPFVIIPGLENAERTMHLRGVIACDGDGASENNTIETTINLTAPMLPYVTEISGFSPDNQSARISWEEAVTYPHVELVTDDVESYKAFAIDGIGSWTTIDVDGQVTAQISLGSGALEWDHAGEPQAFIVFNAPTSGAGTVIKPRSGSQCFISFASRYQNDDWLISPQLSGEAQNISFYAKCAYTTDLNERFEIWASSSSPDIDDFTCVSGDNPIVVTSYNSWVPYTFALPEGTKFFAIRCVSCQQTGLMIDDITYSPIHKPLELWGFNLYRDGVKIANELGDYTYLDNGLENGRTYSYAVTALYDSGESIFSPRAEVKVGSDAGIDSVNADNSGIVIRAVSGGISVKAPEGSPVRVFSIDGKMLFSLIASGCDFIPAPNGFYLVEAAGSSAKVMVR